MTEAIYEHAGASPSSEVRITTVLTGDTGDRTVQALRVGLMVGILEPISK